MTSPTTAAARRSGRLGRRTLTGERRRYGTNGGHQREADGTANTPTTKTTAEKQRTATATRRKRRLPSGCRRRRSSGGFRRLRRGGRGRRRLGDDDGGLPERRRQLERRRSTAEAAAATAKLGHTALELFRRREAKARAATGRGDTGGPFKGARRRRRRPTATATAKETFGLERGKTDPNRTRLRRFPKRFNQRFQRRKGRGDPGDHFPSIDSAGEGKERPDWKETAAAARRRRARVPARGRRRPTSGTHQSAAARARARRLTGPAGPRREKRGFGPTFGPKPKEDFLKPFQLKLFLKCNSIY
uniref:Calcineurin B-like protein n=1 Tax=Oryza sativa subsp. japonica TaxID=39947 RepID=Q5Z493_ORYSJ|nr:calcineurin B-like protein [Oryza sativa Japonica Group]BAD62439.1 calcineurin B-like protein [Oryza sativa Japonica Group]